MFTLIPASIANRHFTLHIAAGTRDALATGMWAAFANLLRFTRRETLHNVVPELTDLGAPESSRADSATTPAREKADAPGNVPQESKQ